MLIYRILRFIGLPLTLLILLIRSLKGKEVTKRLSEKFGFAGIERPNTPLIWCHGASIGEAKSAITLLKQIQKQYPAYSFLLTTGTTTSAAIVAKEFKQLNSQYPSQFIHQFIPIDEYFSTKRFLNYWKPSCVIFLESELWPNLLKQSQHHAPVILANARISPRSFSKWKKFPKAARNTLQNFSQIIAQSDHDAKMFRTLGASNVTIGPNLKFFNPPLATDADTLQMLQNQTQDRSVICLASSHPGDDEIMIRLYQKLKQSHPTLLCVIAPRHIDRTPDITQLIANNNLKYSTHSTRQPINLNTDIYIVDTLGELGNIFSISDITIIGGSFANGGHNPLEPAMFGNIIIWGQDMSNFALMAQQMLSDDAAFQCNNTEKLHQQIEELLSASPQELSQLQHKTKSFMLAHTAQEDVYCNMLKSYLSNDKT